MSVEEYYIYNTLVIEYISKSNKICKITTNIKRKKRYNNINYDFEKKNENKIIFEDKQWLHNSYQKKYEPKLKEIYDVDVIVKIYKKSACI